MTEQAVERMLPLYEAKMIHHYDHRWATYEPDGSTRDVTLAEKQHPDFVVLPRYWVRESVVRDRLDGRWDRDWLLGWRRIARSTDERTFISSIVPDAAFGDSVFLMLPTGRAEFGPALQAVLASFALDFAARQKIGGTNASFFLIEQLPLPHPATFGEQVSFAHDTIWSTWLATRAIALMRDFGSERAMMRAELDAGVFHIYGFARDDVDYVMETFPIMKRKDEAAHGEYRTKRLILDFYDQMDEAIATGSTYVSSFDAELA